MFIDDASAQTSVQDDCSIDIVMMEHSVYDAPVSLFSDDVSAQESPGVFVTDVNDWMVYNPATDDVSLLARSGIHILDPEIERPNMTTYNVSFNMTTYNVSFTTLELRSKNDYPVPIVK